MQTKKKTHPALAACCNIEQVFEPQFFKSLADPNRIAILSFLAVGCKCLPVSAIARHFTIDLSVVSRHLSQLKKGGILNSHRKGKEVLYCVSFPELTKRLRNIADKLETCCPVQKTPALIKRKKHVRRK